MGRSYIVMSLRAGATAVCCSALMLLAVGCESRLITDLERLVEARRLAAEMLVQFIKSADAGNRAVMADTDEASVAYVREANDATAAVSRDSVTLQQLVRDLGYAEESRLLEEFGRCFAEYQALDKSIFELAVENTNLRAQRLSFTSAQKEADAFRDALNALAPSGRPEQASRVQALAATALAAVREIQVLQAPHIAESDEAAMTRLEKRASEAEATARRALATLAGLVPPESRDQVALAMAAVDRFMAVNTEIVALSRRNSNVRSLALSLGQKRTLTARCEESLRALQAALESRHFSGTR